MDEGPLRLPRLYFRERLPDVNINFDNGKAKLIHNQVIVLGKVKAIEKKEKINNTVSEWLRDVEKLMEEVKEQEKMIDRNRKLELWDELLKKIDRLNIKCEFGPFPRPFLSLEHFFSGNFVCFEPTKEALYQLLEALRDDSTHVIGLYGRGGSGKTTLVEAVINEARNLNIFERVLFVKVSQNTNVRSIQDEIADLLNLKFNKNSQVGRAKEICSKLKSIDRTLVILDDVQSELDLKGVGILPCNDNGCKVLLTTRRQRECSLMDCQREIPLGPLSKEEAWTFLKKHSGIDDESPSDLLQVAQEVAFECEGLPGTIEEVGSFLKGKPIKEWKASLDSLRQSTARYQIFLSFRGKDTRHSFTGFLYDALCREGFKTFIDDEGLEGGDEISSCLIKAIEASRLSIIVFSENFAYSSWCLDEVVTILECKKTKSQLIWPIFYKVKPSDVKHQKNSYGQAMAEHEKRFGNGSEKVKKWRSALSEVAALTGFTYEIGYEYKLVKKIVEKANDNKNNLNI